MVKVSIENAAPPAVDPNEALDEKAYLLSSLVASGDCGCDDTLAVESEVTLATPEDAPIPQGAKVAKWEGAIGFESVLTGDGRYINDQALRWTTPIPLRYVREDVGAHDNAVVVGTITGIERREGGVIWGTGVIDLESEMGQEAYRQVDRKYTNGVSMDLDDVSFELHVAQEVIEEMQTMFEEGSEGMPEFEVAEDGKAIVGKMAPDDEVSVTTDARIRAATIVAIPAFADAVISIVASGFLYGYNPSQARAPKGTPRGGQWIDTPTGLLATAKSAGGGGSSTPFDGAGDGQEAVVNVGGKSFRGRLAPAHGKEEALREMGYSTPDMVRVVNADRDNAAAYKEAITAAKAASPYGMSVDVHDSYEGATLYLTPDGLAGVALENGNVVSGFSHPDNPNRGFVQHAISLAVADGGDHLDCYDTMLPHLYARVGFEPVARMPWNDEYAPEGWDYDLYGQYNGGRPDVVFMKYNPDAFGGTYEPGAGQVVQEWDDGVAAQGYSAASVDALVDASVAHLGALRRDVLGRRQAEGARDESVAVGVGDLSHARSLRRSALTPKGPTAYGYNPGQARAPKGTPIGGQWVDTPTGILAGLASTPGRSTDSLGESVTLSPEDIAAMARSPLTGAHIVDGEFTEERKALHDQIVASYLEGVEPKENPTMFMNGGGPGAGKSSMTKGPNAALTQYPQTRGTDDMTGMFDGTTNPGAVLIDPDSVKAQLPEVRAWRARQQEAMRTGAPIPISEAQWAGASHEESSYLSKRIYAASLERGLDVVYDGTGDGKVASVLKKVDAARAAGYRVEANYLYLDPAEGLSRAVGRAKDTGRNVPLKELSRIYMTLPETFQGVQSGVFDTVRLFDNNVERGQQAILVGESTSIGMDFQIYEQASYDAFMSSADITPVGID